MARRWLGLLLLVIALPLAAVEDNGVGERIDALIAVIKAAQQGDGSWDYPGYPVGITALCVLALKEAGVGNDDPAIERGAIFLTANQDGRTYSEGLVCCAMEALGAANRDEQWLRRRLSQAVEWLQQNQCANGLWSYSSGRGSGDISNMQFAVLGLGAARRCGGQVDEEVRQRTITFLHEQQNDDGGWGYGAESGSTFHWTCAGLASLNLLGEEVLIRDECRSRPQINKPMRQGLEHLAKRLAGGGAVSRAYHLYAMERVGILFGLDQIGGVDWYQAGVNSFMRAGVNGQIADLCFQLLFLAKGNKPIAMVHWNHERSSIPYRRDIDAWLEHAKTDLGTAYDALHLRLDDAGSHTAAMRASCVVVSDYGAFNADPESLHFLRRFLSAGGSLIIEARDGDETFTRSSQAALLQNLFPGGGGAFRPLQASHPVCNSFHHLSPGAFGALSLHLGCRPVNVLLVAQGFTCQLSESHRSRAAGERARMVATNLLAWALQNRSALRRSQQPPATPPVGEEYNGPLLGLLSPSQLQAQDRLDPQQAVFPVARLLHRGSWHADPRFFAQLQAELAGHPELLQIDQEIFVDPSRDRLAHCPVAWLCGYTDPRFTAAERQGLRDWLQRGGLLLAANGCGSERFDAAMHQLAADLLPGGKLVVVPPDSQLFKAPFDCHQSPAQVTAAGQQRYGKGWGPLYGLEHEGRWILLYSPLSLTADLHGFLDETVPGYRQESAMPLVMNMLHYAVTP